jgi:DNA-binding transcriptional LysR family regulator
MNLEQLRGFAEVARLGHFTRAAEHLHLAQPSLSRQISTLERDLGAELFRRGPGPVSLTAAGESLLPLARRMLADADSVRREMAELAGLRRGRVRLGATPTLSISLLAEALQTFHDAHPGIELHLSERGSRDLMAELAGGELDVAVVTTTETRVPPGLALAPLLTEELVVVSSASRPPLVRGQTISLARVAALPQIVFSSGYDLRATTETAFRRAGLTPEVAVEGAEMDAVLRFAERGLGVAVVPALVLVDRPGLRSVRLSRPRLTRTISLATPADHTPAPAVAAMRRSILDTARSLAARQSATMTLAAPEP